VCMPMNIRVTSFGDTFVLVDVQKNIHTKFISLFTVNALLLLFSGVQVLALMLQPDLTVLFLLADQVQLLISIRESQRVCVGVTKTDT